MDSGGAKQNQQLSLGSEVSPQLLVLQGFVLLLRGILRGENQPKTRPRSAGVSSAFKPWPVHTRKQELMKKAAFNVRKDISNLLQVCWAHAMAGAVVVCTPGTDLPQHSQALQSWLGNSVLFLFQRVQPRLRALLLAQFHAFPRLSCSLSSGLAQQSVLHLPALSGKVLT